MRQDDVPDGAEPEVAVDPAAALLASLADPRYILRVLDYEGREVVLSLKTWERHIMVDHPEMSAQIDSIESAINDPVAIGYGHDLELVRGLPRSAYDPPRKVRLVLHSLSASRARSPYTAVVVDYTRSGNRVVTAYRCDYPRALNTGGHVAFRRLPR